MPQRSTSLLYSRITPPPPSIECNAAGKATASSLSFSDTPAGAASPPARAGQPAPWEVPQAPLQSGVRTFQNSAAKADNLSNGEAGIYGPEGSQARVRGPGLAPGDQLGGLSRMGSAGTGKGPLAFGFEADSYLAPRHLGAHAGARSHSNLKQTEAGLVQEGHDVQGQKAYAGKPRAGARGVTQGPDRAILLLVANVSSCCA